MVSNDKENRTILFICVIFSMCAVLLVSIPTILMMNPTVLQWFRGMGYSITIGLLLGFAWYFLARDRTQR